MGLYRARPEDGIAWITGASTGIGRQVALDLADIGYVMEIGRIVMDGTADRLKESEDIKTFYLGHQEVGARGEKRWKKKKTWR